VLLNCIEKYKTFYFSEIFAAIPTTQCQMLLSLANKMTDTLEQCRLLLLAMRKFTSLVNEHGVNIKKSQVKIK
jgi:hypothetical protein